MHLYCFDAHQFFFVEEKKVCRCFPSPIVFICVVTFLIVSESSFGGVKENLAKMPCLSEAIFLCASLMMICSLFFLVYENVKNK